MSNRPNHHHRAMRSFLEKVFQSPIRNPSEIELTMDGILHYQEDHDRLLITIPAQVESITLSGILKVFWEDRRYRFNHYMSELGRKLRFQTRNNRYLELRLSAFPLDPQNQELFIGSRYHD